MNALVTSKTGTVHVFEYSYANPTGGTNIVGKCNKFIAIQTATTFDTTGPITCKNCAKQAS